MVAGFKSEITDSFEKAIWSVYFEQKDTAHQIQSNWNLKNNVKRAARWDYTSKLNAEIKLALSK